jgi:transposase
MEVVYQRCCGLDVHKQTVVACVLTPRSREIRTFGTMTEDLLALVRWLQEAGCQQVAMESTGSYWKPIYNLLEAAGIPAMVVNARHMKAVKGRKTDIKDAEWIADLLRHGLLQPSFIPDRAQRELRELVQYRRSLIQERAREVNRLQKVLEGANIKLASVIRDVTGVAGRAMLAALIAGATDPEAIAAEAKTNLKATPEQLRRAVQGRMGEHQRQLLGQQLTHIDFLAEQIATLDAEIAERLRPFEDELRRLDAIPGIDVRGAQEILAWIGTDMSRFPTERHLASWAKVCPGNNQSGGKRHPGSIGKVTLPLRTTLIEAAYGASHKRDCYLAAQFWRLVPRKGKKRAAMAVAHSILVIAYHILKDGTEYQELGGNYFEQRRKEATVRRLLQRLESLGVTATIQEGA